MTRLSPTLRMLLLVPLLATGVDVTRATLACGPAAQTCLEAAGRGWMGVVAVALVPLYAVGLALMMSRSARRRPEGGPRNPGGFLGSWAFGTAGVAATCAGQLALASLLGDGAALAGPGLGGLQAAVLCVAAGALVALALRVGDAVAELRPRAPRRAGSTLTSLLAVTAPVFAPPAPARGPARGRGPPAA